MNDRSPGQATNDTKAGVNSNGNASIALWQSLFIALVVGLFAVAWLAAYSQLEALIWKNDFMTANRWTIPVGVAILSLLVGLVGKYMQAPNLINGGGPVDALNAGDISGYKTFWGALLSSFLSLVSGASVGPEGPIGILAVDISEWLAQKLKLAREAFLPAGMAGLSSAYNGIVGNPIFAALFATEMSAGKGGISRLVADLATGAVGFILFALLGVPAFAGMLAVPHISSIKPIWIAWAVLLGVIGALIAAYIGIAFRIADKPMSFFGDRIVLRAVVAGAVIGIVCYFIPQLMFSGESSIHEIVDDAASYGIFMLLLMAVLKPALMALSFKGGYLGGPIFPSLFTAVMVGLVVNQLIPSLPLEICLTCIEVGVVTLVLKAPLTSILLVALVAGGNANLDGLIVVASATALIAGQGLQALTARKPHDSE
ncbi:MAG: chloride channel protein [Methanotrichaceae archaeon]|nr:chloride channel protein [Methanotrichaceae archaeon]